MSHDLNQPLMYLLAFFVGPYLALEGQSRGEFEDSDDCCHLAC